MTEYPVLESWYDFVGIKERERLCNLHREQQPGVPEVRDPRCSKDTL